jgi:hypothetical protein
MKIQKKKFKNYSPKIKEECGVFGVSNTHDASTLAALGLHALQHRGQEGCGIVSFDGTQYHSEKRYGLVGDNFNKEKVLKNLFGKYAIGHNRYSTTGENTLRNIQPFFADTNAGGIGGLDTTFGFFFGFVRAYIISVCIFSGFHIVYNHDKWPINNDQSYVFPYLKKGSNYLIKEFPNEKTYQDSKEKIQEL